MKGSGGEPERRIGKDPKTCAHERKHIAKLPLTGDACLDCGAVVPKPKWGVWILAEKRVLLREKPDHAPTVWWTHDADAALAKAERSGGKAAHLDWIRDNAPQLVAGAVSVYDAPSVMH